MLLYLNQLMEERQRNPWAVEVHRADPGAARDGAISKTEAKNRVVGERFRLSDADLRNPFEHKAVQEDIGNANGAPCEVDALQAFCYLKHYSSCFEYLTVHRDQNYL